jgi:HAD superfamily phosphatase (TIGR01668 family)
MIKRFSTLTHLNSDHFKALGITHALLLIDVDNTLLSPNDKNISEELIQWIKQISVNHHILLCTNNFTKRQFNVGIDLNLPILMRSLKPFPWRVRTYLKQHLVDINSVIVIGDQVMTDVLLAMWLNRPYYLIKPMIMDKHWITRFFRILESLVIKDE